MGKYLQRLREREILETPRQGTAETIKSPFDGNDGDLPVRLQKNGAAISGTEADHQPQGGDGLSDLIRPAAKKTQDAHRAGTDKTDRSPLLSVLAVPSRASGRVFFHDTPIRLWAITFPDGRVTRVSCTPPTTMEQLQAEYPGAVAEPVADPPANPHATGDDKADWDAMRQDVRRALHGTGVEHTPVLKRLTAVELADWRTGHFGPAAIREFAGAFALADTLERGASPLVKCADCRHFQRLAHPHIGVCGQHESLTGANGNWDDDQRVCSQYWGLPMPSGGS